MDKEQIIRFMSEAPYPMGISELCRRMDVPKPEQNIFKGFLKNLEAEGEIILIKGGRYGLPQRMNLAVGRVQAHPDGYGFLIPDKAGQPDVFINAANMKGVWDGDRVVVRVEAVRNKKRYEGKVIRVLSRGHHQIIGRYEGTKRLGYIVPLERRLTEDIVVPKKQSQGAKKGDIVVARIVQHPTPQRSPIGQIIEILGREGGAGLDEEIIIRNRELPVDFPDECKEEAGKISQKVLPDHIAGRLDLRDQLAFTIDGESAKDFDDAVSIEDLGNGDVRLWVHIADVGFYVKPGGKIDKEAYKRGTSVYFPDRVLPMLPFDLSDGICSLKPDEERLALSVGIDFGPRGGIKDYQIRETVIKSKARLTYTLCGKILEGRVDKDELRRWSYIIPSLNLMNSLSKKLRKRRQQNGSLDFDLPEPEIILDVSGNVQDILKLQRNDSHLLIEEFMLMVNQIVATYLVNMNYPAIFRIHELPDEEKLMNLFEAVNPLGYSFPSPDKIKAKDLQKLLAKAKGRPEEQLLNMLVLRSMKRAIYAVKNIGHFGLAMPIYTHFTSPIRRYPDLIVHRLIRGVWGQKKLCIGGAGLQEYLEKAADHSSARERIAEDAEREIVDLKRVRYMQDKLGGEYTGIISGVTSFGIFVELDDIFVEGLVHISSITDDFYHFNEAGHQLKGERTGRIFRLGDKVKIRVDKVDLERRQIDFGLIAL
ncbi:ribonuclease R [bacterium]|nr:ribonuclease R [bacterium]